MSTLHMIHMVIHVLHVIVMATLHLPPVLHHNLHTVTHHYPAIQLSRSGPKTVLMGSN